MRKRKWILFRMEGSKACYTEDSKVVWGLGFQTWTSQIRNGSVNPINGFSDSVYDCIYLHHKYGRDTLLVAQISPSTSWTLYRKLRNKNVAGILLKDLLYWSPHRKESKRRNKYIVKIYIKSIVGDQILKDGHWKNRLPWKRKKENKWMNKREKKNKRKYWCLKDLRLYQEPTWTESLYEVIQMELHSGHYLATPKQINCSYFSVTNTYFSLSGVELCRYNSLKT